MERYALENLSVSLSPHVRDRASTRGIMVDVCIALAPAGLAAMVIFGWGAIALIAVSVAAALLSELAMCKVFGKKSTLRDGSAFVTGLLIAYNVPANAPWWMAALGSAFAIIIVKQLFGGLGHNFLNPAMTARAFLLASWPVYMTSYMTPVVWHSFGSASGAVDAVATATPLALLGGGAYPYGASYMDLFLGNIPGTLGEVCKLALLAGGLYLIVRRVIDPRIPVIFLGTLALLTWLSGKDALYATLSGGAVLGAFFMLTDYVTCPVTTWGRVIYAAGAALIVFAIRSWSGAYPEGITYGILFMNLLAPLIERVTRPKIYGEVAKRA